MNKKPTMQKIIIALLCFICIVGFFMPSVNVRLSFLGFSETTSFSLATFFERNDGSIERLDFEHSDLGDIVNGSDMLQGIVTRLIFSITTYTLSILLILAVLTLTIIDKGWRIRMALSIFAFSSFISAGIVISTVPAVLVDTATYMLGFLALFLNIEEMFNLSLGSGYFVTLSSLIALLFTNIIIYIDKNKQRC